MNTETINQLKGKYREFLLTDFGKEMLEYAVVLQKRWSATSAVGTGVQKTKYVKKELLPQEIQDRMTLIKINPIALNNQCHNNAEFFSENGFESRTGYNVFACPCGKSICLEQHSVNEKDGVLYDFTKDFNGEPEKWFLELKTRSTYLQLREVFDSKNLYMNMGCECSVSWGKKLEKKTTDEFLGEVELMEQIIILG